MGFYRRAVLPWLMEKGMSRPEVLDLRRRALRDAAGRILEIGFGFGGTLAAYPAAASRVACLVGLEPNRGMNLRAARKIPAAPFHVSIVRASAAAIPFPGATFDMVTSNWTLCSLPDLRASLGEIVRVLRPGGRFLFLEHGRAQDPRVRRRQRLLAPLFHLLADGCRPDLPIDEEVRAAGLSIESLERFEPPIGPRTARQFYLGSARR